MKRHVRESYKAAPRRSYPGIGGFGIVVILFAAAASSYMMSGRSSVIKPASGTAQAMSQAKTSTEPKHSHR